MKFRFKDLLKFDGTPHQLALAFGLGVALGIIPGTGALAAALLAAVFRLNLPIVVAGALMTNPLTAPFIYLASYRIGHWLLGDWMPDSWLARLAVGIFTGNPILAVALGLVAYFVVFGAVVVLRKKTR